MLLPVWSCSDHQTYAGVAEALVQHTRLKEHALIVMSSRGAGWPGATNEVMNSCGMGSVSKYCIRNVPYATIIVPSTPGTEPGVSEGPEGDTAMKVDSPTRVCVCVDGSELSAAVLSFAARHFPSASGAELHLVCVAAPQQLPVCIPTGPQMLPASLIIFRVCDTTLSATNQSSCYRTNAGANSM